MPKPRDVVPGLPVAVSGAVLTATHCRLGGVCGRVRALAPAVALLGLDGFVVLAVAEVSGEVELYSGTFAITGRDYSWFVA